MRLGFAVGENVLGPSQKRLGESMDDAATKTFEAQDIIKVMALLPHRYPFLMIDRIIDARGDEYGVGLKNVTINEPHFQGHFPGKPVMPGVLLIEGMAQTAGALCVLAQGEDARAALVFLTGNGRGPTSFKINEHRAE